MYIYIIRVRTVNTESKIVVCLQTEFFDYEVPTSSVTVHRVHERSWSHRKVVVDEQRTLAPKFRPQYSVNRRRQFRQTTQDQANRHTQGFHQINFHNSLVNLRQITSVINIDR